MNREYQYDELNRLIKTTAVRRFGADVDIDPNTTGVQAEATRTIFATDGQIDYELIPTAGRDVAKDCVYDSLGRVEAIQQFDDDNAKQMFGTGDTLLAGFEYTRNKDGSRSSEVWTEGQNQTSTSWLYDGLNRLVKETYDANDRLLSETRDVEGTGNTADGRHTVYGYGPSNAGTDQTAKTVHQGLDDRGTVVESGESLIMDECDQ